MRRSPAFAAMAAALTILVAVTAQVRASTAVPALPDAEKTFATCIHASAAPDVAACLQQSGFNVPAAGSLTAFSLCATRLATDSKKLDECFATNQISLAPLSPTHVSHALNLTSIALGVIAGLVVNHAMTKQKITYRTVEGTPPPPPIGDATPAPPGVINVPSYSTTTTSVVETVAGGIVVSQVVPHLFTHAVPSQPTPPSRPDGNENEPTPTPPPTPTPTQVPTVSPTATAASNVLGGTSSGQTPPSSNKQAPNGPPTHSGPTHSHRAQNASRSSASQKGHLPQTLLSEALSSAPVGLVVREIAAANAIKNTAAFQTYVPPVSQPAPIPVYAPIALFNPANTNALLKNAVDGESQAIVGPAWRPEAPVSRKTLYVDTLIAMFAGLLLGAALQHSRGDHERSRHRPHRETILELRARRD